MKMRPTFAWVVASALGLGLGFDAMLLPDFIQFGIAPDTSSPPTSAPWHLAFTAMMWVVGGLVLGGAQALVPRFSALHRGHWIVATAVGFGAAALTLAVPLQAAGVLGRIPGPAEPIMFTIGGCVGAGVFQWLLLRRQGFVAGRWLRLWIAGLVLSLVPTALMFFVLQGLLGLEIVWPVEVFLNGVMCAGVAAWVSGGALFSALARESSQSAHD
jgi:hypothetical protein